MKRKNRKFNGRAAAQDSSPPKSNQPGLAAAALRPLDRVAGHFQSRWALGLFLFVATGLLYLPALGNGFVSFDDPLYVTANAEVNRGLTWSGMVWAFHSTAGGIWLPLTWLSHMLDCQFYGLRPWGHHLTSILLHATNTLLVFLWLQRLTGAVGRSFAVAALFGFHPLHVESVAWVAERKDVLSTLFWLLALMAYTRFAEESKAQNPKSRWFYVLALLAFACGLMAKPMLVTLPFVLLLLDCWPLRRISSFRFPVSGPPPARPSTLKQLLFEKWPFFALSVLGSLVALAVQRHINAMAALSRLPLGERIENAVMSCVRYAGKLFWPEDLCVYYPYREHWPGPALLSAASLLVAASLVFLWQWRRHPALLVGWLWFLGTLVPVIGLVQVGEQAMADRYTYVPQVGLLICLVWAAQALGRMAKCPTPVLAVIAGGAVIGCLILTHRQIGFWKDDETLFEHTLAVTEKNYIALTAYGNALYQKGRLDDAMMRYRQALEINPNDAQAENNLGLVFYQKQQMDEAMAHFQKAVTADPGNAEALLNLGNVLLVEKQLDGAVAAYTHALEINPALAEAQLNLGNALFLQEQTDEAIVHFQKALALAPDNSQARHNLAVACNKSAWLLATSPAAAVRNGSRAVELAREANQLAGGGQPYILGTLAAAYAQARRFPEALATARQALQLADAQNNPPLAEALKQQIRFYEADSPFCDNSLTNAPAPPAHP